MSITLSRLSSTEELGRIIGIPNNPWVTAAALSVVLSAEVRTN